MINPDLLRAACDRFGIALPASVAAADRREEVAREALLEAEAVRRPDPASATAEDLTATVEAALDFDTRHAARVELLRDIARRAKDDIKAAWFRAASSLVDPLGEVFDRRAADFLTAIGDRPAEVLDSTRAIAGRLTKRHDAARSAANDLDFLWKVRRDLGYAQAPANVWNSTIADLGLVLEIPDPYTLSRRIPAVSDSGARGSAEWWAAISAIPGVRIKWHNRADLIKMAERCRVTKPPVGSSV